MPELPEVEVTRRSLTKLVVGRTILRVETTKPSYFFLTAPAKLREALPGLRIVALDRIGKYLLARLSNHSTLLLHLGMTGQLFGEGAKSVRLLRAPDRKSRGDGAALARGFEPDLHTHLTLRFEDGGPALFFRDVRKFGKVLLLRDGASDPRLEK